VSALASFVPALRAFELPLSAAPGFLTSGSALRIDALSSILIPLAAALWLLTVAVTPRTRLDRTGLRRTALATLVTMSFFMTTNPVLLLLLWFLSNAVLLSALSGPASRRARRVAAVYLGTSMALFAAGIALVARPNALGGAAERLGIGLIIAAALIRKGIFPFHAWVPEVFDRGRLGPAVLFSAPQLGSYVTAVLIVPLASTGALRIVAVLALVTAVYGAALALFQRDARRSCGYLFVSQSALVMAGLDCTSKLALAGSLVLWVSSALAFTGIARCVLVLEARRGRLDLTRHHGGYQQMPQLAVSFLVLGLACTGFPGTLGFVGEELLVDGAVDAFPILGFFVIGAGALTGLAVLRMYFSLFCGRRDDAAHLGLLPREALAFAAVASFLIGTGIAPGPIVASRLSASELIFRLREDRAEGPGSVRPLVTGDHAGVRHEANRDGPR
jgi:NADH-quinone oxidoreductase subunit M